MEDRRAESSLFSRIESARDFERVASAPGVRLASSSPSKLPRSVIFLDVDGVLHPLGANFLPSEANFDDLMARADTVDACAPDDASSSEVYPVVAGEFLPRCLAALRRIVEATGAEVVLSSTWRETLPQTRAVNLQLATGAGLRPCCAATPCLSVVDGASDSEDEDEGQSGAGGGTAARKAGHSVIDAIFAGSPSSNRRAGEIVTWLVANGAAMSSSCSSSLDLAYVVLDDQDLCEHALDSDAAAAEIRPRFLRIDARSGLTEEDADAAIAILTRGGSNNI